MTGDIAIETPGVTGVPEAGTGAEAEAIPAAEAPTIRIVSGNPTPAQVAALTAVLAGMSGAGGGEGDSRTRRSLWSSRSRFARPRPAVGAGGWRASGLPR